MYGLGADEATPPPGHHKFTQTCFTMIVHLHMSLSSSAAPVADIGTYSGMCGRYEEATWRKTKSITGIV